MHPAESHARRRAIYLLLEERQAAEARVMTAIAEQVIASKKALLERLADWLWEFSPDTPLDHRRREFLESISSVDLERWVQLQREARAAEAELRELPAREIRQRSKLSQQRKVARAGLTKLLETFLREALGQLDAIVATDAVPAVTTSIVEELSGAVERLWRDHAAAEREAIERAEELLRTWRQLYDEETTELEAST